VNCLCKCWTNNNQQSNAYKLYKCACTFPSVFHMPLCEPIFQPLPATVSLRSRARVRAVAVLELLSEFCTVLELQNRQCNTACSAGTSVWVFRQIKLLLLKDHTINLLGTFIIVPNPTNIQILSNDGTTKYWRCFLL
jgi:hypothetical protein